MEALLNLQSTAIAYDDTTNSSRPERMYFSWSRNSKAISVKNPQGTSHAIPAGGSLLVFDGTRSTSIDNTTGFEMLLSPLVDSMGNGSRYRFWWDSGQAPEFRTARSVPIGSKTVTVTVNSNRTVVFASEGGDWSNAVVGDWIFIPSVSTGDGASPFNDLNCGYWTVLSVAGGGASVTAARLTGTDFTALAESVVVANESQLQVFSADGVQIGDMVDISAGFSTPICKAYQVVAINPNWFEVVSVSPLPTYEYAVPTTAGIAFYSAAKNFVRVEVDQEAAIQLNGNAGFHDRVSPLTAGDKSAVGWAEKYGVVWSLTIVNRSSVTLNATVITAE